MIHFQTHLENNKNRKLLSKKFLKQTTHKSQNTIPRRTNLNNYEKLLAKVFSARLEYKSLTTESQLF